MMINRNLPIQSPADDDYHILLWNLRCATAQQIVPGLTIHPLKNALTVFDLAAAGAVGFREWATIEVVAESCTSEITSTSAAATLDGYNALNRAWLATSMMLLRGCGKLLPIAVSSYSWNLIAGFEKRNRAESLGRLNAERNGTPLVTEEKLLKFSGGLLDYRRKLLLCPEISRNALIDQDAQWINENFNSFNLMASSSEKFRFALEAATDWRYAHDQRSAIARPKSVRS